MIFITVGTEKFSFGRLIKAVEEGIKRGDIRDEVFAQIGSSKFLPRLFSYEDFIDYDTEVEYIKKADIVISHGGEGTIFLCLSLGKIPLVFPRQVIFKEHFDDHQVGAVKKMESKGMLLAAYTGEELIDKIKNYKSLVAQLKSMHDEHGRKNLINHLRRICCQEG